MSAVVVTSVVRLASPPSDVWPLITDTDRTNRLIGTEPVTFRAIESGTPTSARFVGETRTGGFTMSYEEAPFEWTYEKSFSVYRKMRSGPLKAYTYGIQLEPTADAGTQATVRLELEPRHWLLKPIAKLQGARFVQNILALADAIDAYVRDRAPSPYLKPKTLANEERLVRGSRDLVQRGLDQKAIDAVISLIRDGADADVVRIRPFELAQLRGVDPREMLRALLHGVTVGIVELRWALVCPSCRTANDQVSSLSEIGDSNHCQLCDIQYGVELDRAVEATFVPHPSVREVQNRMFCIGGPARTPHVLVQTSIDVSGTRELDVPVEPGRYRLFARGGMTTSLDVIEDGPSNATATLQDSSFASAEVRVARGGKLRVTNASAEPRHVKIERLGYASLAATAHVVTTMSEFRRFFSRELLKPSTPLKVASCAILFSDLTGSTALYTKAGDAAAFRLVDDHFDVLRKAIDGAGGSVVKTMGDAVMASFVEPTACVRGAIECLRAFEAFRATQEHGELTGLKLGLYAGPCYVIRANDLIDYFGQTVNCASRVQHLAESGEIVMEAHVFEALPEVDRQALKVVEHFETRVKGVDAPLRLVRTRL
ncbi:DUF5939 domain-containing protein [Labilithrix luteola]|nr:DUF5939 domain-containing protein [Labilithrix luteola]